MNVITVLLVVCLVRAAEVSARPSLLQRSPALVSSSSVTPSVPDQTTREKPIKSGRSSKNLRRKLNSAIDIRGGGGGSNSGAVFGTPISKENLAWLLMGECFFNGIIGLAAPETLAETFSMPNVRDGSLAHLSFEFVGAGLFSIAMALYLARFTRRPAHDIVAFSSLPSAFVAFRHFLKGTPSRIGYRRGVWEIFLAYYVIGIEAILSRKGDTILVSKIFAAIPAVIGLNGMLDRSFARAVWGINIADGATEAAFRWMSRINFQCSILYLLLLNGFDPLKSAGYIALTYAFQCIDFAFITRDREGYPNQPEWLMKLFVIIWTLTGIGLLRD